MFEVNGIDDFYDKNAMITYEINGHEIPVHMKPHFTPQIKSLFPEYAKDSPKEMAGFVRGKGSRSGGKMHGYIKQINSVRFHPVEGAGLTINDMPEYKLQHFTGKTSENMWKSLEGMKEDRMNGVITNGFKQNQALQRMFQKQLPVISSLKKIQQSSYDHHIRKNDAKYESGVTDQSLKYHVPRYQGYSSSRPFPINREFVHNQREQQRVANNNDLNNGNPKLLQQFMASRNNALAQARSETNKVDDHFTSVNNGKSAFTKQLKSSVSSQMEQQQHYDNEREGDANSKARIAQGPVVAADRYKEHEDIQATTLFKNLDSLHKKLQIDKQINQEEQLQSKLNTHQHHEDPHKAQAKTRILNLLGELTEKLKGMESIVTKHQNKAIAEKFMTNRYAGTPEIEGHSKEEDNILTNTNAEENQGVREVPSSNSEPAEAEAMDRLGAQLTEKVSSLQHGLDEGLQNADSRSYKEDLTKTNAADIATGEIENTKNSKALLADSFMKIDGDPSPYDNDGQLSDSEETANHRIENKEMTIGEDSNIINNNKEAMIQSFHHHHNQQQQESHIGSEPIIMNTKVIDYKQMDDEQDTPDDDNNNKINNIVSSSNLLNSYGEEEIHDLQDSPKHRKKFVGKEDDDDEDGDSDENEDRDSETSESATAKTLKKHWKKPEVDEDPIPSRQTLMKYHHNNVKDSEDSEQASSLTDNDAYNGVDSLTQINKKKAATRRHKAHRAHHHNHHKQLYFNNNNNDKDSQEDDIQNSDDEERDEDESIKTITSSNLRKPRHHHKRHHKHLDNNDDVKSLSSISPVDGVDGKAIAEDQDVGEEVEEPTTTSYHHNHHHHASIIEDKQDRNLLLEEDNSQTTTTTGAEDSGERENTKMFEVEESLGEAEEKNNIARHRSFKPKALGKLIPPISILISEVLNKVFNPRTVELLLRKEKWRRRYFA